MTRDGPATRARILEFIRANPGLHKSEVCRQLGLSWGTVGYHMRALESSGLVKPMAERREVRFFAAGTPERHMRWIAALRQAQGTDVLGSLARSPGRGIAELSRELLTSRKVVRRHLTTLDEAGILADDGGARPRFLLGDDEALLLARALGLAAGLDDVVPPGGAPVPAAPGLADRPR
jgi:predicted transcriptional regulator